MPRKYVKKIGINSH